MGDVIPAGLEVATGEPTGVRLPLLLIWNDETVFPPVVLSLKLLTNSSVPAGFTAKPKGFVIPVTGEPATEVSDPVMLLRLKTDTVLSF